MFAAAAKTAFPRPVRIEPVGSRRLQIPRTRLVIESGNVFGERPRTAPIWKDY